MLNKNTIFLAAITILLVNENLPAQTNPSCCYYDSNNLLCTTFTTVEDCAALGGQTQFGAACPGGCDEFPCNRAPRLVRHGSAKLHGGIEYLIPSGQSECRQLDVNGTDVMELVFEFDRPIVGSVDSDSDGEWDGFADADFTLINAQFHSSASPYIVYSEGDRSLRLIVTPAAAAYVGVQFEVRSYDAVNAPAATEVKRKYAFAWPVAKGDVNNNGVVDEFDKNSLEFHNNNKVLTSEAANYRYDINLSGAIDFDDVNSFPNFSTGNPKEHVVTAVSRKIHDPAGVALALDIPAGEIETRLDLDTSGNGTARFEAVFTFESFDASDPNNIVTTLVSPKPVDCDVWDSTGFPYFCVSSGAVTNVDLIGNELSVVIEGVVLDDKLSIAFRATDDAGNVFDVNASWLVFVGAVNEDEQDFSTAYNGICGSSFFDYSGFPNSGLGAPTTQLYAKYDVDLDGELLFEDDFGAPAGDRLIVSQYQGNCDNSTSPSVDVLCPVSQGACCTLADDIAYCEFRFASQCTGINDRFYEGADCSQIICNNVGSCTFSTPLVTGASNAEACFINRESECVALGGSWQFGGVCSSLFGGGYTIRVDRNADSADVGSCWYGAYTDLQQALADASNSALTPVNVLVAEGTYFPAGPDGPSTSSFEIPADVRLIGGFAGSTWENALCDDRNPEVFRTILSGDLKRNDLSNEAITGASYDDNVFHVVTVTGLSATDEALVDGVVVSAGVADGVNQDLSAGPGDSSDGGCIYFSGLGTLRVIASDLSDCHAANRGGAIFTDAEALYIDECTFERNTANIGAALAIVESASNGAPSVFMRRSRFEQNEAIDKGGAVACIDEVDAHLMNTWFEDNHVKGASGYGGAVFAESATQPGTVSLANCLVGANSATGAVGQGGGVYTKDVGMTLRNCTVGRNLSTDPQGIGVYCSGTELVRVINSIIFRNGDFDLFDPLQNIACEGSGDCYKSDIASPSGIVFLQYSYLGGANFQSPVGEGNFSRDSGLDFKDDSLGLFVDYFSSGEAGNSLTALLPTVAGNWSLDDNWVTGTLISEDVFGQPRLVLADISGGQGSPQVISWVSIGAIQAVYQCCAASGCSIFGNNINPNGCKFVRFDFECDRVLEDLAYECSSAPQTFCPRGLNCGNYLNPTGITVGQSFEGQETDPDYACNDFLLLPSFTETGDLVPNDDCDSSKAGNFFFCDPSGSVNCGTDPVTDCSVLAGDRSDVEPVPQVCLNESFYFRFVGYDLDALESGCELWAQQARGEVAAAIFDRLVIRAWLSTPDGRRIELPKRIVSYSELHNGYQVPVETSTPGRHFVDLIIDDTGDGGPFTDDAPRLMTYSYSVVLFDRLVDDSVSVETTPCGNNCCRYSDSEYCGVDCNNNDIDDSVEIWGDGTNSGNVDLDRNFDCQLDGCDPDCPPVDIVFIIDTSGSMTTEALGLFSSLGDAIENLGVNSPNISVTILRVMDRDDTAVFCPCELLMPASAVVDDCLDTNCIGGGSCDLDVAGLNNQYLDVPLRISSTECWYGGLKEGEIAEVVNDVCCGDGTLTGYPAIDGQGGQESWGLASILVARDYQDVTSNHGWRDIDDLIRIIVPISDELPCGGTGSPGVREWDPCLCSRFIQPVDGNVADFNCEPNIYDPIGATYEEIQLLQLNRQRSTIEKLVEVARQNDVIISPIVTPVASPTSFSGADVDLRFCFQNHQYIEFCLFVAAHHLAEKTGGSVIQVPWGDTGPAYDAEVSDRIEVGISRIIRNACASATCDIMTHVDVSGSDVVPLMPEMMTDIYEVPECSTVTLNAAMSTSPNGSLMFNWDIGADGTIDFQGVEFDLFLEANEEVSEPYEVLEVVLEVIDGSGCAVTKTIQFNVIDSVPTVAVSGPTTIQDTESVVFSASVGAACDDVIGVSWRLVPDDNMVPAYDPRLGGSDDWPAGSLITTDAIDHTGLLEATVMDSDGDTATASIHVTVVDEYGNETFNTDDPRLEVVARHHSYEVVGTDVFHSADLILTNKSAYPLHGEIFVEFANLTPAGTTVENAYTGEASTQLGAGGPLVKYVNTGEVIGADESIVKRIEWKKSTTLDNGPFSYDAVAHLRQQPPVIRSMPPLGTVAEGIVGADPEMTAIQFLVTLDEGQYYEYAVDAFDPEGDPLQYSLKAVSGDLPTGIGIDFETGLLRWTPGENPDGDPIHWNVSIDVTDGFDVASQTVRFVVEDVNRPPVFAQAYGTETVGQAVVSDWRLAVYVTDPDGDEVNLSILGVTGTVDNRFTAIPDPVVNGVAELQLNQPNTTTLPVGVYALTIVATDGMTEATMPLNLRVVDASCGGDGGAAPSITPVPNPPLAAVQGQLFQYQVLLDQAYSGVTYSLTQRPEGMSISADGLISWTPAFDSNSSEVVTVKVVGESTDCSDTYSFNIAVTDSNAPPTVESIAPLTADEGTYFDFWVAATDADADSLRYALLMQDGSSLPAGLSIAPGAGVISWSISQTTVKDNLGLGVDELVLPLLVRVTDTAQVHVDTAFTLTVNKVNVAPEISSSAGTLAYESPANSSEPGPQYTYLVEANDPDVEQDCPAHPTELCYELIQGPSGMAFSTTQHNLLEWTPPYGSAEDSPYYVEILVSDGDANDPKSTRQTWVINVVPDQTGNFNNSLPYYDPAVPDVPASYAIYRSGTPVPYVFQFPILDLEDCPQGFDSQDPTACDLTYDVTIDPPAPMSNPEFAILSPSGEFTWIPAATDFPEWDFVNGVEQDYQAFEVRVVVTDSDGGASPYTFNVGLVNCSFLAIQVATPPLTSAQVGTRYTFDFEAFDAAVDSDLCGTDLVDQTMYAELVQVPFGLESTAPLAPLPSGLTVTASASIENNAGTALFSLDWDAPTTEDIGTHFVGVRLTSSSGTEAYTYQFPINVTAGVIDNTPPQIVSSPLDGGTPNLVVGTQYTYQVDIEDPDVGDVHHYELCPKPAGAEINEQTGLVTWTPMRGQECTASFNVRVTDAAGASDEQIFALGVAPEGNDTNDCPPFVFADPHWILELDEDLSTVAVQDNNDLCPNGDLCDPDGSIDVPMFFVTTGPAGLQVTNDGPDRGRIIWDPVDRETGTHRVVVEAIDPQTLESVEAKFLLHVFDDGLGGGGLLAPTLPIILSSAPQAAATEQLYSYPILLPANVQGAARIVSGPSGATVDASNVLQWIPNANQLGRYEFVIRAELDAPYPGIWTEQTIVVTVSESGEDVSPCICSNPVKRAYAGSALVYQYPIDVVDDGVAIDLDFSLDDTSIARGMTISNTGVIRWTPDAVDDLGIHDVTVRVEDSGGGHVEQFYKLRVIDGDPASVSNTAPQIISITPQNPDADLSGSEIVFDVLAVDAEQASDTLTYTVVEAAGQDISFPGGASPAHDDLVWRWTPSTIPNEGTYTFVVKVEDGPELADIQDFEVTVSISGTNYAPEITSQPPTSVPYGQLLSYKMDAFDANHTGRGDLTWEVVSAVTSPPLVEMFSNQVTIEDSPDPSDGPNIAVLKWDAVTVAHEDIDSVTFTVEVSDPNGAFDEQTFTVQIEDNQGPVIETIFPHTVQVGTSYVFELHASDADHEDHELLWFGFPGAGAAGDVPKLTQPSIGYPATFSWTPSVANDAYLYHLAVRDDWSTYGAQIIFNVVDAGTLVDEQDPQISISLSVSSVALESHSATDISLPYVVLVDDDQPLPDQPGINISVVRWDGIKHTTAYSGLLPLSDALPEDGLGANGKRATGVVVLSAPSSAADEDRQGAYRFEASIVDAGDNESSAIAVANVYFDSTCPLAQEVDCLQGEITGYADEDGNPVRLLGEASEVPELTGPTIIRGFCHDIRTDNPATGQYGNEFERYELSYRPVGMPDEVEPFVFATSYAPVLPGSADDTLGVLDATAMLNGTYDVFLTCFGLDGSSRSIIDTVIVSGNRKVGNFTVSFNDLQVPVVGIPATVTRTYDSRDKFPRDFGVGWQMGFASMKIEESYPIGYDWGVEGGTLGCYPLQVSPHTISVQWPDGRLEIFEVKVNGFLDDNPQAGDGCSTYTLNDQVPIEFTPLTRGGSKLTVLAPALPRTVANAVAANGLTGVGVLSTSPDALSPVPFEPTGYQVESPDGVVYEFKSDSGPYETPRGTYTLSKIIDRNGNILEFTEDGIRKNNNEMVIRFERDEQGRIKRVFDPDDRYIEYEYDDAGDLVRVTDRTNQATRFVYNDSHGLIDILDPRGVRAVRNIYDDEGRLITVIDAASNRTEFVRPGRDEPLPPGYPTIDPAGIAALTANDMASSYDVSFFNGECENYEAVIDPLMLTTLHCYDDRGNVEATAVLSHESGTFLESLTRIDYDEFGRQTRTTDAVGRVSEVVYRDSESDLVTEQRSGGRIDGDGDYVDYRVTKMQYGEFDQITATWDAANLAMHGGSTGGNNQVPTAEFVYDSVNGNLQVVKDAEGRETVRDYFSDESPSRGLARKVTDRNGVETNYTYYPDGNLHTVTDDDLNVTTYYYDEVGRRTREVRMVEVDGAMVEVESITEYDASGRVTRRIDEQDRETITTYNSIGKEATVTDINGGVTEYEYDIRGQVKRVIGADETETAYTYDEKGRQLTVSTKQKYHLSGDTIRVTKYEYDQAGNRVKTYLPDDTPEDWSDNVIQQTAYDAGGRVVRTYAPYREGETQRVVSEYFYENTDFDYTVTVANGGALPAIGQEVPLNEQWVLTYVEEYDANFNTTPLINGYLTKAFFDEGGRQYKTEDARSTATNGNYFTEIEYSVHGQQLRTIFPGAAAGLPTTCTKSAFDPGGRKISDTDQNNLVTGYGYDNLGRTTSISDAMTFETTYIYDLDGNLVEQYDANLNNPPILMSYDEFGRMISRTLPEGQTETWTYDQFGNQESYTDFNGVTQWFQYDDQNRLTYHYLPSKDITLSFTEQQDDVPAPVGECSLRVSGMSDLIMLDCTVDGFIANDNEYTITLEYAYPDAGEPNGIKDELFDLTANANISTNPNTSFTLDISIDSYTQLREEINTDVAHIVIDQDDNGTYRHAEMALQLPPLTEIYYDYDVYGQRTVAGERVVEGDYSASSDLFDTYDYDRRGQLIRETKSSGDVLEYEYDDSGNRTLLKVALANGEFTYTAYGFDRLNRLIRVEDHNTDSVGDPTGTPRITYYRYDANGNRAGVKHPNGTVASYEYDRLNRLTRLTNRRANMSVISDYVYTLDEAGNRTRVVEEHTNAPGARRTVDYVYDDNYRLVEERITNDPDGKNGIISYTYDRVGNRLTRQSTVDGMPWLVEYTYDHNDRLITEEITAEAIGAAPNEIDPKVYAAAGAIDPMAPYNAYPSVPTDEEWRAGGGAATNVQADGDAATGRVGGTRPTADASAVSSNVDALARAGVTLSRGAGRNIDQEEMDRRAGKPQVRYVSADGRRPHEPSPYSGWLVAGFTLASFGALLYPVALLRSRNRGRRAARRGGGARSANENADDPDSESDHLFPLATEGARSRRRRIWRGTISLFCIPVMLFGADTVLAWDHDARLYRFMQEAAGSASMGYITTCGYFGGTIEYEWDANGNLLSRTCGSKVETFEYDYQNRLIRKAGSLAASSFGPGSSTSFGYDVDGVRNRVIHNATDVTHMITDKNRPYAQVVVERKVGVSSSGGGGFGGGFGGGGGSSTPYDTTLMRYVYGDDLISQSRQVEDTSGATYPPGMVTQRRYYHYDGQMSTRQMTDESSAAEVKLEYVYDAFGIDLLEEAFLTPTIGFGQEAPTVNQYRYTGEQYDDDVGMYYLRARYYAHRQGRFATRDPFEGFRSDPMSLHKYLYAHGNPVMNRDPSGLNTIVQIVSVQAIMTGIVSFALNPTGTAKFVAYSLSTFINFLAALTDGETWIDAVVGIVGEISSLLKDPAKAAEVLLRMVLEKVFFVFAVVGLIWDIFSSVGLIGAILNSGPGPEELGKIFAVIVVTIFIGAILTASIGAVLASVGPKYVYRNGGRNQRQLTPRESDGDGLSAWETIQQAARGNDDRIQPIDVSKLDQLEAIVDNVETGHVSIRPKDMSRMREWQLSREAAEPHEFTRELMNALGEQIKK